MDGESIHGGLRLQYDLFLAGQSEHPRRLYHSHHVYRGPDRPHARDLPPCPTPTGHLVLRTVPVVFACAGCAWCVLRTVRLEDAPLGTVRLEDAPLGTVRLEDAPLGTVRLEGAPLGTVRLEDALYA